MIRKLSLTGVLKADVERKFSIFYKFKKMNWISFDPYLKAEVETGILERPQQTCRWIEPEKRKGIKVLRIWTV